MLNTLNSNTTGLVTATSVATLTGTAAAINTLVGNEGDSGDKVNLDSDYVATLSDTTITATVLNTVNGNVPGTVNASTVATITGAAADINTAYESSGISGLGNEALTVSGTLTVSQANALGDLTTGAVTATISDGDMTTLAGLSANSIVPHAHTITVTDTSVAAATLNTLDGKTSVAIDGSAITTLTGSETDVRAAFGSSGISGLTFDAANYIASYGDLINAFGFNTSAAESHYYAHGLSENRSFDSFDETSYLASNGDLITAFGSNTTSAVNHYINHGYSEGRDTDSFKEFSYIASYTDLMDAFGDGGAAALQHYISHGYGEGRTVQFDEVGYLASHSDLITVFGSDTTAAAKHYINYGYSEGRTITFDAASYLAANADLRAAFGSDENLAKQHYIEYGHNEGRSLS